MIPPRRWEQQGKGWALVETQGRSMVIHAHVFADRGQWYGQIRGERFPVASAEAGRAEVDRRLAERGAA